MKLINTSFFLVLYVGSMAIANDHFKMVVQLGDKKSEFVIEEGVTKPEDFSYFMKKAMEISKLGSQDQKFCKRDFYLLSVNTKAVKKDIYACARSKVAVAKKVKNLANLLSVQYGK